MKRKIISMLLCVAMVGTIASGCGGKGAEEKSNSITVMVESGSSSEAVARSTAEEFENQTGCKVNIDAIAYNGMYDKISTEIKARQSTHDVACLDVVWLAAFKDAIAPINNIVTKEEEDDFLPTLKDGGTIDGQLLGYPTSANCKVLIYRKDLFNDEANKTAFKEKYGYDLKPPTTWKEYTDISAFFTKGDLKGTAVFGKGSDAVCSWLDFACQAGAGPLVLDENNKVLVADKPYVDALEFMKSIVDDGVTPGDDVAVAATESQDYFLNGKIAMQLNWSHQYPAAVETMGADKVGVAPMIAGSAGIGATTGPWYECVMKNSKNQEMALKYVQFMFGKNAEYMKQSQKVAGRTSIYEEYGKQQGNEHLNAVLETLNGPGSQNRPATSSWTEIEEVLGNAIQSALSGNRTSQEALNAAKEQIESIISTS